MSVDPGYVVIIFDRDLIAILNARLAFNMTLRNLDFGGQLADKFSSILMVKFYFQFPAGKR